MAIESLSTVTFFLRLPNGLSPPASKTKQANLASPAIPE